MATKQDFKVLEDALCSLTLVDQLDEPSCQEAVHLKVEVSAVLQQHTLNVVFPVVDCQDLNVPVLPVFHVDKLFEVVALQMHSQSVLCNTLILLNNHEALVCQGVGCDRMTFGMQLGKLSIQSSQSMHHFNY